MHFIIITGMSGAGKSLALDTFEDNGYFCVDNLPPTLILKFADLCQHSGPEKVALVSDIRGGEFFDELFSTFQELDQKSLNYEVLFLDAADETLVRRFKETRRRHPLAKEGRLLEAIEQERKMLEEIKGKSTKIINTSELSVDKFRAELKRSFAFVNQGRGSISISLISFGFKYGVPLDADTVFDVRFMPNPHYVEEIKLKTGETEEVQDYIFKWPVVNKFYDYLFDFMKFLMPEYIKEGKSHLTIAIGCTGGKHRSVASVIRLKDYLKSLGYRVSLKHRDINK
ncbi:MAG: RNase adapter RapZ [Bacillota bacterium]